MGNSDQNPPDELSARIKFTDVVKRLEKIATTTQIEAKKNILKKFFDSIFALQKRFRDEVGPDANASLYPFLRLFLANKDLERGSYGVKAPTLGKLFVSALALNPKTSADAKKLTNLQGNANDYGDIVYDVMRDRSPAVGTLTVYEVNKYLDLIAEHFEQNERNKIDREIVHMLDGMSALDRKWLTRILLKKLALGVGEQRVLETYNPNAFKLYNQCSVLSRVCEVIDSNLPLDQLQFGIIELFKPIRPMLCERGYLSKISQLFSKDNYYLETKMDGERCQAHINGTEFKYFSRNCKEITKTFGATSNTGLYSPFLYKQLNESVKSAILDGEMMVWDNIDGVFSKKAENSTAKYLTPTEERYNICFVIYDLIYYNGECLAAKPYAERVRLLSKIIKEQKGALMLCDRVQIRDAEHFLELFNKAFDANEEGVVIKREDSKYSPAQREKGGWFKMKADYENNLISDFDLLIIGGYYNDKRTAVDSFLLAVLKKAGENDDSDVFYSVCKIRNGLNQSQWAEILKKLEPIKHNLSFTKNQRNSGGNACPDESIDWGKANPDFWYDPKLSIVVQIKASELVETSRYRTSHSFRFPRVMAVRWDKTWDGTCSLAEFDTFCQSNSKVERLTKRHATSNDLIGEIKLPKRRRNEVPKPSAAPAASNEMQVVDDVCKGLDFCIVNAEKNSHSVEELKNMVRRHGGRTVDYPSARTFVIIAANPKILQVTRFIKSKLYDIAKPEWLVRALGGDQPLSSLIKFTPDDMLFATDQLQQKFAADDFNCNTEPMDSNDNLIDKESEGGKSEEGEEEPKEPEEEEVQRKEEQE